MPVNTFIMLQNNISNKCCSFELLLNVDGFHQYIKQQFLEHQISILE